MSTKEIVNGEPFKVVCEDGREETVHIKRLTIRERYIWAEHVRDKRTPDLVCLCTGRKAEWVDTLSVESFGDLAAQCVTANFQKAMTLAERDPVMAMVLGPVVASGILSVAAMLEAQRAQAVANQAGPSGGESSPAPAPSASAVETGSASST